MGAGQSNTSHSHPPTRALHVLRVTPSSPASETTIEPFFDFVVGFEGDSLATQSNIDASQLEKIVEQHEGKTLNLLVWNSKNKETRVVPISPSRAWSSPTSPAPNTPEAEADAQPSLLGLSMRVCEPEFAGDNVWHVMDVLEGSPSESAGLVPYGDWIIGWSGGVLSAENDFYDLVEAHIEKPLRVYVYNYDFDNTREVVLVPNRHWGGEGLLGCVFGFGLIHRIPAQPTDREPGTMPPELTEPSPSNEEFEEQQLFVPADIDVHDHHDHDHDHDHDHSHGSKSPVELRQEYFSRRMSQDNHQSSDTETEGHNHSRERGEEVQTPRPGSGYRGMASPTPTRPTNGSGSFMNGHRSSWLAGSRSSSMFHVPAVSPIPKSSAPAGPEDGSSEEDDGGYDGAESVADTETTDMSETNSLGSLTSVD